MPIADPEDIIKAYGFVFIYAGNLEYAIEECYESLTRLGPVTGFSKIEFVRLGFKQKIKIIKEHAFEKFDRDPDFLKNYKIGYDDFKKNLERCLDSMSSRNATLSRSTLGHLPLFAKNDDKREAYITHRNGTEQSITSAEVTALANILESLFPINLWLDFLVSRFLKVNPLTYI